jgi:Tfp pilus assembly protein PilN
MLRFHLNLATNPFVNFRKYFLAAALLLLIGLGGALGLGRHYVTMRRESRLLSEDLAAKQHELEQFLDREGRTKTQLEQPATLDAIDRVNTYNLLIQHKTFPWTQFFRDLEAVIPYNVQVTQIQQRSAGKKVNLEMVFMGRTTLDALNFLRNLGNSKRFRDLVVSQEGSFRDAATHRVTNEVEVMLHLDYVP